VALALCISLISCSSSKSKSPSTSSAGGTPSDQITALFTSFFNGKTSATAKVGQLQNGQTFASLLEAQAKSALAKGASAKVSSVTLTSASLATVKYTISINGTAALPDQTGYAVLENGQWKVADASFCGLLALEQANAPACSGVKTPS
jgi:hypothetical protein